MAADDVDFAGKSKKASGSKLENFCHMIWNGDKKEFLGRTGSSWAKIGLFYLIFYGCLAGFFATMLVGFFSTISETSPTQQNMYSLIKQNPGMGFRPMHNIESTLIRFNRNNPETYEKHVKDIHDFLTNKKYFKPAAVQGAPVAASNDDDDYYLDPALYGDCSMQNGQYGYQNGTPCVLLKINRVFNWMPIAFNNDTLKESDMPAEAKENYNPQYVTVTCEGENDADIDNVGKVSFYPAEGFDFKFFPYKNTPGYKSPIVFAKFGTVRPGTVVQVWCKLWVKNIKHHKNDKGGSVHFELLVDIK